MEITRKYDVPQFLGPNHPEHIEEIPEAPTDEATVLSDEQLAAGGLVKVAAFMRTKASANALRVKKHREKAETEGIKQINVQAPEEAREIIKTIAERTKAGETITQVLASLLPNKPLDGPTQNPLEGPTQTPLQGPINPETMAMAKIGCQVKQLKGWRRILAQLAGLPV